jgi:hypothetical protein
MTDRQGVPALIAGKLWGALAGAQLPGGVGEAPMTTWHCSKSCIWQAQLIEKPL